MVEYSTNMNFRELEKINKTPHRTGPNKSRKYSNKKVLDLVKEKTKCLEDKSDYEDVSLMDTLKSVIDLDVD